MSIFSANLTWIIINIPISVTKSQPSFINGYSIYTHQARPCTIINQQLQQLNYQ